MDKQQLLDILQDTAENYIPGGKSITDVQKELDACDPADKNTSLANIIFDASLCGIDRIIVSTSFINDSGLNRIKLTHRTQDVSNYALDKRNKVEKDETPTYVYPTIYTHSASINTKFDTIETLRSCLLEGLQQTLLATNKTLFALLRRSAPVYNEPVIMDSFTEEVLLSMRTQLNSSRTPAAFLFVGKDILEDILDCKGVVTMPWEEESLLGALYRGDKNYAQNIIRHNGFVCSMLGTPIYTDAFLHPSLRVLRDGECFFTASPNIVGTIGVQAPEITVTDTATILKYNQYIVLINPRGIVMGNKK